MGVGVVRKRGLFGDEVSGCRWVGGRGTWDKGVIGYRVGFCRA